MAGTAIPQERLFSAIGLQWPQEGQAGSSSRLLRHVTNTTGSSTPLTPFLSALTSHQVSLTREHKRDITKSIVLSLKIILYAYQQLNQNLIYAILLTTYIDLFWNIGFGQT